jgi:hypothetical protein
LQRALARKKSTSAGRSILQRAGAAQTTNKHNYASNKIKQPYKIQK